MSRKSTPDIMGNLMEGTTASTAVEQEVLPSIKQESIKTINKENSLNSLNKAKINDYLANPKTIQQESIKTTNKVVSKAVKEKTTFNLSLSTLTYLEDAWMKLRRKLKGEVRITKTLIVEKAIEMALADFESKSELSELYNKLKNSNKIAKEWL